jgi:hypothetical protein
MLRRRQGIEEFTDDPACIFRISLAPAGRSVVLSDGASIRPADPIVEIHYWNEHMPQVPEQGLTPAWAGSFRHGLSHSLSLIADLLIREPRFREVAAIYGAPAFAVLRGGDISTRISRHLGFDVLGENRDHGAIHTRFDSMLVWALTRTFNRGSGRGHGVPRGRLHIWMSRRTLIERYGPAGKVSP